MKVLLWSLVGGMIGYIGGYIAGKIIFRRKRPRK